MGVGMSTGTISIPWSASAILGLKRHLLPLCSSSLMNLWPRNSPRLKWNWCANITKAILLPRNKWKNKYPYIRLSMSLSIYSKVKILYLLKIGCDITKHTLIWANFEDFLIFSSKKSWKKNLFRASVNWTIFMWKVKIGMLAILLISNGLSLGSFMLNKNTDSA